MPSDSGFKRLAEGDRPTVTFKLDGETIRALQGETVAAALLAAGRLVFRETAVSGADAAPFA